MAPPQRLKQTLRVSKLGEEWAVHLANANGQSVHLSTLKTRVAALVKADAISVVTGFPVQEVSKEKA